jgi:hypothetical protein
MKKAIWMRRGAATLLLTAFLSFPVALTTAPTAAGYSYVPAKLCPIDWRQSTWFVKQLIRCAAHHYGVSADKAISIARRESMFDPHAYNASQCAEGIYQHLCRYWPGRAYDYGFKGWSAFNARANVIVTMRMVHRHGWWPWGG